MVYVPTVFVPPGQQGNSSNNSTSSNQQQQQQYQSYSSPPVAVATAVIPTQQQQQSNNNDDDDLPPFSQSLSRPPPSQRQPQQQQLSTSMPPQAPSHTNNSKFPGYPASGGISSSYGQYGQQQPPQYQQQQQQQHQYGLAASAPPATYDATISTTTSSYSNNHHNSNTVSTSTVATTGLLSQQSTPVQCHKVDYEIKGNDCQLVEVQLDPNETVIAEAGAMMYLEDNIDFQAKFSDGSNPSQGFFGKLMAAGGRILTGESVFLTHFTNRGHAPARAAFGAPYPGTILAIDMQQIAGQKLYCERDAFLCAALGTKVSVHFHKKFGAGLFGGEGFMLQKIKGDGMVFVHAGGTIIKRELHGGERLRVDTGCLVAFTEGINYDIQRVPGLTSMFFGGEGIFLATLQGTGTVWLQSLPFSRMCDRILSNARSQGGTVGEGSHLTGQFGNYMDGDGVGGGLGALSGLASALGKM